MNPRDAVLAAADSIDTEHDMFSFMSIDAPDPKCGTPGCALGWIYYHLQDGNPAFQRMSLWNDEVVAAVEAGSEMDFYTRMNRLEGIPEEDIDIDGEWQDDPTLCAETLRHYATKFLSDQVAEKTI